MKRTLQLGKSLHANFNDFILTQNECNNYGSITVNCSQTLKDVFLALTAERTSTQRLSQQWLHHIKCTFVLLACIMGKGWRKGFIAPQNWSDKFYTTWKDSVHTSRCVMLVFHFCFPVSPQIWVDTFCHTVPVTSHFLSRCWRELTKQSDIKLNNCRTSPNQRALHLSSGTAQKLGVRSFWSWCLCCMQNRKHREHMCRNNQSSVNRSNGGPSLSKCSSQSSSKRSGLEAIELSDPAVLPSPS